MRDHNDIWPWLEDLVSYAVANSEMDALMQRAHFEIDQALEEDGYEQIKEKESWRRNYRGRQRQTVQGVGAPS